MGVWEPYMGVRPWVEVIPLGLLAPLEEMRRAGWGINVTLETLDYMAFGRED